VVTVRIAYERSGYGPQDVQLIELHDAFTIEELVCPDTLGLVLEGEGSKLLVIGDTVLIGRIPANRNGGLIAMGHPLGLTGLGQIAEILWQMHRVASLLQLPQEVHVALAHMVGAGGVYVIHMLRR
jgi:acetyl-CoA acetyltransferase